MNRGPGKIGLVGAGAVGSFYGLMLHQAGRDVHFHLRSNYRAVKQNGFCLIHRLENTQTVQFKLANIYQHTKEIGNCDWVIIATKATANQKILDLLAPMVGNDTSFLTLQNGMGNVENLSHAFGQNRLVMGGLCFTCINRTSPNTIESLLPGYVQFGQIGEKLTSRADQLVECFEEAGIKTRKADTLDEALWRKLCWNVPFNGLCIVAGGMTTDCILADSRLKKRAWNLMVEIQLAARGHGILIEDDFLARQFSLTERMGAYKPSSLIDYLAGRPVEVEAIWGEPLRRGILKNVKMPELSKLYQDLINKT